MSIKKVNAVYKKIWKQQESYETSTVSKQTLDYYLENNSKNLKKFMKDHKLQTFQLFKNAYILNAPNEQPKCDCSAQHTIVHVDLETYANSNRTSDDLNGLIWLPSTHSLVDNVNNKLDFDVYPLEKHWLESKKVCYKKLCCKDDKWKYVTHPTSIGLRYSYEEADCPSNYRNFKAIKYKDISSTYLDNNLPEGSLIKFDLKKNDIKSGNTKILNTWLDALLGLEKAKTFTLVPNFNGYEDSILGIYDIKETRNFVIKALEENPALLYFAVNKIALILCYIGDIDEDENLIYDEESSKPIINQEKLSKISNSLYEYMLSSTYFSMEDIVEVIEDINYQFNEELFKESDVKALV